MQDLACFRLWKSQDQVGFALFNSLVSGVGSEKFYLKWDSQTAEPLLGSLYCMWWIEDYYPPGKLVSQKLSKTNVDSEMQNVGQNYYTTSIKNSY